MSNKRNFIPRSSAGFDNWFRHILEYVDSKTDKDNPEWPHIMADRVTALRAANAKWREAYEPTLSPHAPQLTREKNRERLLAEREVRRFIKQFLRFSPVTDLDRDNMNIRNHSLVRTNHIEVHEVVKFELLLRNIREVVVRFWVRGASDRAKPRSYDGAVIVWGVLDAPPQRLQDLTNHKLASRTPCILTFDETERGKMVYIAAAWQNERGYIGPWSEIQGAIIP
ncbi:MAG: hypothetical protein FWG13_04655 [Leptospirales bacterium]|nr:hypothetical protein [Leptospirales bacterium]